jgi:ribosomal protein S18 acetylase RimI-like enzyme
LHTYFLGREEVAAYAKDLAERLVKFEEKFPYIWCTMGHSGEEIALVVGESLPDAIKSKLQIIPMSYERDKKMISFQKPRDKKALAKNAPVMVIDSSVHSGETMLAAHKTLGGLSVKNVCSYSLVLKRGASFVPNMFGLIIQEHDRAYFLLDKIPNHRIMAFGALRQLSQMDANRRQQQIKAGLKSLSKVTWCDLLYEMKTTGKSVFVYEESGKILGFISFQIKNGHLFIDAIAVDKTQERRGIGGNLMRWAETSARLSCCKAIELWAIEDRMLFYQEKAGFKLTTERLEFGSEKYSRMERTLLYNIDPHAGDHL